MGLKFGLVWNLPDHLWALTAQSAVKSCLAKSKYQQWLFEWNNVLKNKLHITRHHQNLTQILSRHFVQSISLDLLVTSCCPNTCRFGEVETVSLWSLDMYFHLGINMGLTIYRSASIHWVINNSKKSMHF